MATTVAMLGNCVFHSRQNHVSNSDCRGTMQRDTVARTLQTKSATGRRPAEF